MHSFHRSRPRIFFEVLCALGMAASFVGAWLQTYAPAFLPAAAIAGLYGLVHAFDMVRRKPAEIAEPQAVESVPVAPSDTVIRTWPLTADTIDEAKSVEPTAVKAPRKKRTSKAVKPVQEPEIAPAPPEPQPVETSPELEHAPIAPLFEPEPFVRTQRAAFGRKGG